MSSCAVPLPLLLALLVGFVCQTADEKRDADDAAKLVQVLNLRPGSTVADVGAGAPGKRAEGNSHRVMQPRSSKS
jgi:hypothetical protein